LVFCAAVFETVQDRRVETADPATAGKPKSLVPRILSSLADLFSSDRPMIILEKEVEITKDIPQGVDMGCKSNNTLPAASPAPRPPEFFEEPAGTTAEFFEERRRAEVLVEKPTILLEEEVEITKDIPRGTSFDQLSNRNLDNTPRRPAVEP
jgi:hypothetical protein